MARQRVSKLLTIGDAIGHVDPEAVRAAAAAKLTPTSERFAVMLANLVLANVEGLALILAGQASDEAMSALLAALEPGSIDLFDAWLLGSLTMADPGSAGAPLPP